MLQVLIPPPLPQHALQTYEEKKQHSNSKDHQERKECEEQFYNYIPQSPLGYVPSERLI
jgi:hypothetical protein